MPIGADPRSLFRRPHSLRYRSERRWFWINLWLAPVTAGLVAIVVLHQQFRTSQVALLIVLAMVYVTLARGRLLGTSVRVHERQLPHVLEIARRCSRMVGVPEPLLFVRDDPIVPITAMGLGEPYAIVISSQWLSYFDDDELEFLIGRELGHIAAGHTRITSLFSASGKENPLVALVFGPWLRRTEYTADRIGLLCCRSMEAAVRAIYACSFRELKRDVDFTAFIDQRHAIAAEPSLAMGEWLGESPYAVNRLRELGRFERSDLYAYWTAELDRTLDVPAVETGAEGKPVPASLMQRGLAFAVDLIVVSATVKASAQLLGLGNLGSQADVNQTVAELASDPNLAQAAHWIASTTPFFRSYVPSVSSFFGIMLYSAILVAIVARTCGMMIFDLRVVRNDYSPAGVLRILWRYVLGLLSFMTVVPIVIGLFSGFWVHERWSGTRLVRGTRRNVDIERSSRPA